MQGQTTLEIISNGCELNKKRCLVDAIGWDPAQTVGAFASPKDLFDPPSHFMYGAIKHQCAMPGAQPPKSLLSGGLFRDSLPDKGGLRWVFLAQTLPNPKATKFFNQL